MGGILSHHAPSSSSYGHGSEDYQHDITNLRRMIKQKSKLILLERYVFILYGPPGYPLHSTAEYIRDRVSIPIFPSEEEENLNHLLRDQKYESGFILLKFSSKVEEVEAFRLQIEELGMKLCLFFFEMDGEVRQPLTHTLSDFQYL